VFDAALVGVAGFEDSVGTPERKPWQKGTAKRKKRKVKNIREKLH
jgi:hypothetical protein